MKQNLLKTAAIILLVILGISLNAQDKNVKDKLAELNGKVEKVTIKVDGKDVVFEGKEAERIVKLAKATGEANTFIFKSADGKTFSTSAKAVEGINLDEKEFDVKVLPGAKKRVKVFKGEGSGNVQVITGDDLDWKTDGGKKKVEVKIKDGKKSVTVTTNKDGKEETKTYEGDEAEKFINEEGGDGSVKVIMKKVDGDEFEDDNIMVFSTSNYANCCCKSKCNTSGKKHISIKRGGKGNMMWKMNKCDLDEKEVHVIIEKKKDVKETKENKKESEKK